MKSITGRRLLLFLALVAGAAALRAQAKAPAAFLPREFDGWQMSGEPTVGTDPGKIDDASADVLREDRFTGYELATYKQEDRVLTIRAARFDDAEGAYAAFTFYRQPRMRREKIGTLAASLNDRVIFFSGTCLVDAQFDHVTAMSGTQLRDLTARLPQAKGPAAALPSLPNYLPRKELVAETARYVIGPGAFSALSTDLSPSLIDFSKSPELLWARVNGEAPASAQLLLIAYPTPRIAMDKLPSFEHLAPASGGETSTVKRTGPIVALVRGRISRGDAEHILDQINYDAEVTWNENTGLSKRDNIGNLVIAALTLAGVLVVVSVGVGLVFGLGRFLLRRLHGGKSGKGGDDGKMIRLDLDE